MAQMRMRAVEQGVGAVRVANTGISAVLDSTGGYVMQSPIGQSFVYDSQIPKRLEWTLYSWWGDFGAAILCVVLVGFGLRLRVNA